MKAVAGKLGTKVPADATVETTVGIGPRDEGGFGLDIDLKVDLPGLDRETGAGARRRRTPGLPLFQRHPQ